MNQKVVTPTISYAISIADEITSLFHKYFNDVYIDGDLRKQLPARIYYVIFEHLKAVTLLTKNDLTTTSASIIRLIHEALVKGIWLQYIASEQQLEKYDATSKTKQSTEKLIDSFSDNKIIGNEIIKREHTNNWAIMCEHIHVGSGLLSKMSKGHNMEPSFSIEEQYEILIFAAVYGMIGGCHLGVIADKDDAIVSFADLFVKNLPYICL